MAILIILKSRESGPFTSFTDFCLRVDSQKVNRKVLESLIKAGAMDRFGRRAAMLAALDKIRSLGTSVSKLKASGQSTLFGTEEKMDHSDSFPEIDEFAKPQLLSMEKELLGFYLTEHPHTDNIALMQSATTHKISDLYQENLIGQKVTIGGIVESCRKVITKTSNQPMCFARISDLTSSVEIVVFPKIYATSSSIWQPDNLVLVSGRVESRSEDPEADAEITIIIDAASSFPAAVTSSLSIDIPKGTSQSKLVILNSLLQSHKGSAPANLVFYNNGASKILSPYLLVLAGLKIWPAKSRSC